MRRRDKHPVTGKRVSDLGSVELRQQLVTDAIAGVETPIWWFQAACLRAAALDRTTAEQVFQDVRAEVRTFGGVMPGAPGT